MDRRKKSKILVIIILVIILLIIGFGSLISEEMMEANFSEKNRFPSLTHLFGTDWLGRDMFFRTIKGLENSLLIGTIASVFSSLIAIVVGGLAGTMPKWVDNIVRMAMDLVMGIPHLLFIILISVFTGRGIKGLIIGIALTHWVSLARVIRNEVLQIKNEPYVLLSRQFGKNNWYIFKHHMIPLVLPQYIIGLVLMFPHAILHEAAVTFLGFGLAPEIPSIGIILSESMRYLISGMWHLAFFPGVSLVCLVLLINKLGENISLIINPYHSRE